jgi:gamma-glutamylcyclotransferase (GGCT)/AIG2-like uncharacterized protein YtfP
MDPTHMRKLCPGARSVGRARLPEHRLVFLQDPIERGPGFGSVVADPGGAVWGVLWDIGEEDLASLDSYEGYPIVYERPLVTIDVEGESLEALAYVAVQAAEAPPAPDYLEVVIRGALAHGLPGDYVASLRRVPTA